eukprot:1138928-Pelagomonas_calceolata.AAC.2
MSFVKDTLGLKRATTNWAVLRECGHAISVLSVQVHSQLDVILKMYNGLLNYSCETLRKVLNADLHLHSRAPLCWTAQILDAHNFKQKL